MVESGTYDVSAAEVLVREQIRVVGSSVDPRPVSTLDIRADGNGSTALWGDVGITGQQLALSSKAICAYLNAPASTLQDTTATAASTGSADITAVQPGTTLRNVDVTQATRSTRRYYMGGSASTEPLAREWTSPTGQGRHARIVAGTPNGEASGRRT
jgi:hypothetical protein